MTYRSYFVLLAITASGFVLSGCSYQKSIVPNTAGHPANPEAAEATVLISPAETLASEGISTQQMPEMDHSHHSMKH